MSRPGSPFVSHSAGRGFICGRIVMRAQRSAREDRCAFSRAVVVIAGRANKEDGRGKFVLAAALLSGGEEEED